MTALELEDYIARSPQGLDTEPNFYRNYCKAQILVGCGRHNESLRFLQEAYGEASTVIKAGKEVFIWGGLYYSIGGLYAVTLDYLGQVETAETIFNEIIEYNPTGLYIGEYAVFLHRRKRDFEKAQSYYTKALHLFPEHSSIHLKYAGFLRHVRRDLKGVIAINHCILCTICFIEGL